VKGRQPGLQLSDEQQLILGLLLVILVAISLLYCLGFASLAIRDAWQEAPSPWTETEPSSEDLPLEPVVTVLPTAPGPTLQP
jgi:hypothetical protein